MLRFGFSHCSLRITKNSGFAMVSAVYLSVRRFLQVLNLLLRAWYFLKPSNHSNFNNLNSSCSISRKNFLSLQSDSKIHRLQRWKSGNNHNALLYWIKVILVLMMRDWEGRDSRGRFLNKLFRLNDHEYLSSSCTWIGILNYMTCSDSMWSPLCSRHHTAGVIPSVENCLA